MNRAVGSYLCSLTVALLGWRASAADLTYQEIECEIAASDRAIAERQARIGDRCSLKDGKWREPFGPYAFGHGAENDNDFTEGNAFQYSWHVMQDVPGLVAVMGGREKCCEGPLEGEQVREVGDAQRQADHGLEDSPRRHREGRRTRV